MRLCEHPEFEQAIQRAAEHFHARGLRPAIIEKDYHVTEALRVIQEQAGTRVIFKGGTSLSKGWNLIQRFSEDVDLFVDPEAWQPSLGTGAARTKMRELRAAVGRLPGLSVDSAHPDSGAFRYRQLFGGLGEVAGWVLLEIGTASGSEPTEDRPIESFLSQFLRETKTSLEAQDEKAFPMRLLHFRRTFVEKLFAIHSRVVLLLENSRRGFGTRARHYYDLACLADTTEVQEMLGSDEYSRIRMDYDKISREHFSRDYRPPEGLRFNQSIALFPTAELAARLEVEYKGQCQTLCYGTYPSWHEVLQKFRDLQHAL